MKIQIRAASSVALLAVFSLPVLSNDTNNANRHNDWQQGFPLSIIEGQEPAGRPDLNRPLSYRDTEARIDQVDPLMKTASVIFDINVKTVGEAARVVLKPVGYEMVTSGKNVSPMLSRLLGSPLPDNQRGFSHLRVHEMLRALAGVGYVVVFDHVQRRATFDPLPRYIKLGNKNEFDSSSLSDVTTLVKVPVEGASLPYKDDFQAGQWRAVASKSDSVSFSDQVATVIKNSGSTENEDFSTGYQELILNSAQAELLDPKTEMALRRVATRFDPNVNRVVVSNCSGDVSTDVQSLHGDLITKAMNRLGVNTKYLMKGNCSLVNGRGMPEGKTQHMIVLTELSAGAL